MELRKPISRLRLWRGLTLAMMSLTIVAGRSRAEVVLVKGGKPAATIVVARDVFDSPFHGEPGPASIDGVQPRVDKVAAAAHDLQVYLEKMTGAKVPIVSGDGTEKAAGAVILVGRSRGTAPYEDKIAKGFTSLREEEGFTILAEGGVLLLAGNDDGPYHGTEYAVAEFLHRQGVRWYMPGEFGEVVPRQTDVAVGDVEFHGKPDFKMRNWWGPNSPDGAKRHYRFKIRNGLNPVTGFIALPTDSSIRRVLPPPDKLDAPEFAGVWGKLESGRNNSGMPNLSSPRSVAYAAGRIKEYLKADPTIDSFGLAGDDGFPRDFSPETVERNLGFPDVGGRLGVPGDMSTTEEWMAWLDAVAAEVHKEYPNVVFTTNGYANRNTAPLGVGFNPDIWIMFAAIWSDTLHAYDNSRSWQTLRQGEMIQQWTRQSKNVFIYGYTFYMLASAGAPIPLARKHAHDMPLYKKWGVVGFINEGRYAAGEQGIFPNYLQFRMEWDASLDPEKLAKEFYRDWYGPAAKPARAFWDALEETMETTPILGHEDRILPYVYSPELMKTLEKHLIQAEKLATDPWSKPRVHADRLTFEHLRGYIRMHEAEWRADFPEAVKQADYMLEQRRQLNAISPDYFDIKPDTGESVGFYYWGLVNRRAYYQGMADLTTGKTGRMIAVLPEKARFRIDPRDEGRFENWYAPAFNDKGWGTAKTTAPFYTQEDPRRNAPSHAFQAQPYRDAEGYPYMGAMWYRLKTQVPPFAAGQTVMLYAPAVETEAWVWVNGQFAGHRPYRDAYERPSPIDIDITKLLRAGAENSIVIRVQTGLNAPQQAAGMTSRLFLYSPGAAKPAGPTPPSGS